MPICEDVKAALNVIRSIDTRRPSCALILGSGLGALANTVEDPVVIPSSELPGYPSTTVHGHAGELVIGSLSGRTVVIVKGRAHAYEGHAIPDVTFPVRLVHALGASKLLVTNAAGGINRKKDILSYYEELTLLFYSLRDAKFILIIFLGIELSK